MGSLFKNLSWKFAERTSVQLVSLVVSIIIARILEPTDYGIVAMVNIFITLANVFVNESFGSALIQKKNADKLDFSSVLYFNIIFSIVLYFVLYVTAPLISSFFGKDYALLTPILRVLGLQVIIASVYSVAQAYVSRKMMFRTIFLSSLIGTIISAGIGIWMAHKDMGAWALVGQSPSSTFINCISLLLMIQQKPILAFSFERLKVLFGYGAKILGSGLLIVGFQELRALIIGSLYSGKDLAFFDKGRQFPNMIVSNISTSIGAVLFPKMAQEQDNMNQIKRTTRQSIRFSSFIMVPLMFGLASIAQPMVSILLTDKWLPCVPFLQWFCLVYLFQPIHTANMQAIKAIGRSDVYLKLEIVKKSIELLSLLAVMRISVSAIVINMAVLTTLFTFINAYPNHKLLAYNFKEQMSDILPAISMSAIMSLGVYFVGLIPMNAYVSLALQILLGAIIYLSLAWISNNKELQYFIQKIKVVANK